MGSKKQKAKKLKKRQEHNKKKVMKMSGTAGTVLTKLRAVPDGSVDTLVIDGVELEPGDLYLHRSGPARNNGIYEATEATTVPEDLSHHPAAHKASGGVLGGNQAPSLAVVPDDRVPGTDKRPSEVVMERMAEARRVNLEQKNVADLKTLAKERGHKGYSRMTKPQLVDLLMGVR